MSVSRLLLGLLVLACCFGAGAGVEIPTGVLLLTFDDRNFKDWERAIPLFAKYGAHATFFMSCDLTPDATLTTKKLADAGHTLVFTSHGIHPDAKGINLKTEWLERILVAAQETGVSVLGFEEIPLR